MPSRNSTERSFFYTNWFLVVIALSAILLGLAFLRAFYRDYQIKEEIKNLQDQVQSLETKKIETIERLKYVKSNEFVKEKAHTELNLANPGEKVMVIQSGNLDKTSIANKNSDVVQSTHASNLAKWWDLFFGDQNY